MKKRPDSALLQKKWRNNSSERNFFSKHFGLIHLAGLKVLKHFWKKNHLYLSSFPPFIFSLLFHPVSTLVLLILSSFSSCFFSCLAHFLFLSSLFSSFDLLLSCLVFSFLLLSSLFFSCLVSLSLSLSVSLSLSLFLSVSVSVWCCVLCCVVWCVARLGTQKTPPCVDSKLPSVYRHHAHMCYHMRAWCRYTRGPFESTHGGVLHR